MSGRQTPAQRVRARQDPALRPPAPIRPKRLSLLDLTLYVAGRDYLIGPNVEGDHPWELTMEGAATFSVSIRSPDESLLDVLADEALLQESGAKISIDDVVYVLSACTSDDDGLYTLTFEDEVSWRMRAFTKFLAANRSTVTRAGFVQRLADEASRAPLEPMKTFIPELVSRQRILAPEGQLTLERPRTPAQRVRSGSTTAPGLGASSGVTVKGSQASEVQRQTIDECLAEAHELGTSPRVMVAVVMCITQESEAGLPKYTHSGVVAAGETHRGPFQQQPGYGTEEEIQDPATATRAFLLGKNGIPGWKQRHGGLKNAPGDLGSAIEAVQVSGQGSLYSQWEAEATRTVTTWLGSDGLGPETRKKRYEFTRGERGGERENSWDASGRLADEVGWRRWAAVNTLFYVSEDELRAQAPSETVRGDEGWLLAPPMWDWGASRAVSEVTLRVASKRWGVMPGGVVEMARRGPTAGRFVVKSVSGDRLDSPVATVILKRPTRVKPEPAPDTETIPRTQSGGGGGFGGDEGDTSQLMTICGQFSGPYLYGGGHGPALSSMSFSQPLDCSSSCSLALWKARMFPGSAAIVSGEFAASWGRAGKGREFTVWASATHVWIEFHDADYKAFDTRLASREGRESGPTLSRSIINDQARFTPRHWPGR